MDKRTAFQFLNWIWLLGVLGVIVSIIIAIWLILKKKKCIIAFVFIPLSLIICFGASYGQTYIRRLLLYENFSNNDGVPISEIVDNFKDYTSSVVEQNKRMIEELPSLDDEVVTVEDTTLENGARLKVDQSGKSLMVSLTLTDEDISANIVCILKILVSLQEKYSGEVDAALIMASEGNESVLLANMTDENGTLKLGALGLNWTNETYKTHYTALVESK